MTQEELFGICPYCTVQKIFSGKWALLLMHHLSGVTLRFGELKRLLPDITQAALTKQLRQLEAYGLIHRHVYAQVPPKVEYSLSEVGTQFKDVLLSLKNWSDKYLEFARKNNIKISEG